MKKILVVGALPESLLNFRGALIKRLCQDHNVVAMAALPNSSVQERLAALGAEYDSYPIQRNKLNPFSDLATLFALKKSFRKHKPEIIFAYTIKPVIWGAFAATFVPRAKFFALITGLGFAFQGDSLVRRLLSRLVVVLYRLSLRRATTVIFQNPDNLETFISKGIVAREKCALVNGSGVDLDAFEYVEAPLKGCNFLMIGRLLGEKGVREYAAAAKQVRSKYPSAKFLLLGPTDPSPDGLQLSEINEWEEQGIVDYLGESADVRPYLKSCHIYVLPSYHEGMPRTVLEAMAIGRPIITTDVSGCRETVVSGENGFLVPSKDSEALAIRLIWCIENRQEWSRMGKSSRNIVVEKFDVHQVNRKILRLIGC